MSRPKDCNHSTEHEDHVTVHAVASPLISELSCRTDAMAALLTLVSKDLIHA